MNKRKKILILGATGQDGSFMAKFMHEKNYFVHCVIRKSATGNLNNLKNLLNKKNFFLHHGDLLDLISIEKKLEYEILLIYVDNKFRKKGFASYLIHVHTES